MAARDDEIDAAEATVACGRRRRGPGGRRLDSALTAPAAGLVTDTLFEPGEFVPAGSLVATLLPPGNLKLRFFVPEADLAGVAVGHGPAVACDRCPAGLRAAVSWVSPQAEYTPPVIYSRESRAKLVYLVEARLAGEARLIPASRSR